MTSCPDMITLNTMLTPLKNVPGIVMMTVFPVFTHIFLYRLCSLGSACDTFFYEKLTGGTKQCTYLPHASLKQFEFVDFVNYDPDPKKLMFVLQCLQGNIEMIFKSFWFISGIYRF